ncbi:hypothetical protein E3A20_15640, partial [Planctomyces bekefii]
LSANTILAPLKAKAFAVETNVYEGIITSELESILASICICHYQFSSPFTNLCL